MRSSLKSTPLMKCIGFIVGVRVIILNTIDEYCLEVIQQASSLGMMSKGWAWVVTDGATTGGSSPIVVSGNSTSGNIVSKLLLCIILLLEKHTLNSLP